MELIHTKKSSATQVKSHHSNVLSYTHVHKNRLDAVAEVNVAKTATFTGKIETSARFLAMRFACKAAAVLRYFSQVQFRHIKGKKTPNIIYQASSHIIILLLHLRKYLKLPQSYPILLQFR